MKAFVTFLRTLFNPHAASAGRRTSQQAFSSLTRRYGPVRALVVLLAAVLLGTGLSALQACNRPSQPEAAAQVTERVAGQVSGQGAGQASRPAAGQASTQAEGAPSGQASAQASGHVSGRAFAQASGQLSGRPAPDRADDGIGTVAVADLPAEARHTLALIRQGGPYPYEKDGTVFGNYERKLPRQRRGYYTEYTVRTPQVRSRGARRIIAGGREGRPTEFYYTDDHYQTFRRIDFP